MAKRPKRQTLDKFIGEEQARDPAFAKAFDARKAKTVTRLGRPPATPRRGQREMRLLVPPDEAELIRQAAEADGRTVGNWLLLAARARLKAAHLKE